MSLVAGAHQDPHRSPELNTITPPPSLPLDTTHSLPAALSLSLCSIPFTLPGWRCLILARAPAARTPVSITTESPVRAHPQPTSSLPWLALRSSLTTTAPPRSLRRRRTSTRVGPRTSTRRAAARTQTSHHTTRTRRPRTTALQQGWDTPRTATTRARARRTGLGGQLGYRWCPHATTT